MHGFLLFACVALLLLLLCRKKRQKLLPGAACSHLQRVAVLWEVAGADDRPPHAPRCMCTATARQGQLSEEPGEWGMSARSGCGAAPAKGKLLLAAVRALPLSRVEPSRCAMLDAADDVASGRSVATDGTGFCNTAAISGASVMRVRVCSRSSCKCAHTCFDWMARYMFCSLAPPTATQMYSCIPRSMIWKCSVASGACSVKQCIRDCVVVALLLLLLSPASCMSRSCPAVADTVAFELSDSELAPAAGASAEDI